MQVDVYEGQDGSRTTAPPAPRGWWEARPFLIAIVLLAFVPLLYPPIPPLVDLLGHLGQFRVQLDVGSSPWLSRYFGFHWAPLGTIGIDVLVQLLAPVFGLEPLVKVIVLLIPPLTAVGFLWVAREVHGRIPPTALFALPLVYNHPFLFGFANFSLSMALAFIAFGLWLRLGRLGQFALRAAVFAPISVVLYFTHMFGWCMLGLMAFSAEAVRQHEAGNSWLRSGMQAALHVATMALPLVFLVVWRMATPSGPGGTTGDWFDWAAKLTWIETIFRDRWEAWDFISMLVLVALLCEVLRNPRLSFSRSLGFSVVVLLAVFILMPRIIFASAYADMRLVPYMFALAILAICFRPGVPTRMVNILAACGLLFYVARIATGTASLAMAADDQRAKLAALDHIPVGARVATFVGQDCIDFWPLQRNTHLGAMVIVRRQGFSNDQWTTPGHTMLQLKYQDAGKFGSDPSEVVRPSTCRLHGLWRINTALAKLPRSAFDYVWLIDVPPYDPRLLAGLSLVWSGPNTSLFRIRSPDHAPAAATVATLAKG